MDDQTPAADDRATIRRRGGRPAKPDHERRRHHIGFYVTTAELAALHAEAAASRPDSLSDHARRLLCRTNHPAPGMPPHDSVSAAPAAFAELAQLGQIIREVQEAAEAGNLPAAVGAASNAMIALGEALWALA